MQLKLTDIAKELGIESPSIYRHYNGLKGVIAGLGGVALQAEIDTFDGIMDLPFPEAVAVQAERGFDLYFCRPGIARFILTDFAVPGGVHEFQDNNNLVLAKKIFTLEENLLRRGIQHNLIRPMNLTTFIAARFGPALLTFSLNNLGNSSSSKAEIKMLKQEYLKTVMNILSLDQRDA